MKLQTSYFSWIVGSNTWSGKKLDLNNTLINSQYLEMFICQVLVLQSILSWLIKYNCSERTPFMNTMFHVSYLCVSWVYVINDNSAIQYHTGGCNEFETMHHTWQLLVKKLNNLCMSYSLLVGNNQYVWISQPISFLSVLLYSVTPKPGRWDFVKIENIHHKY